MAYTKVKIDDNYFKVIHQEGGKKHIVAVLNNEEEAKSLASLLDMMESTWCYTGVLDSEYIKRYTNKAIEAGLSKDYLTGILKSEWNYLDMFFTTKPAGTDSEGVSYRSIIPKEEI